MSFQRYKYFFKISLPSLFFRISLLSPYMRLPCQSSKHQGHSQLGLLHCFALFTCLKCSLSMSPLVAWLAPWSLSSVRSKLTISAWPTVTIPGPTNPLTQPHCVTWSLQRVSHLLTDHVSCLTSVSW